MAGAISEVARQSLAMDFRRIDPTTARIVLIEAGPRIMPALPQNLSDYMRRTLAKKGVEVMTSTRVISCDAHGVELEHALIGCRHHHLGCRRGGFAGGALARCAARSHRPGEGSEKPNGLCGLERLGVGPVRLSTE
jgi:NADH dehydrogenase FAD-containing subunit